MSAFHKSDSLLGIDTTRCERFAWHMPDPPISQVELPSIGLVAGLSPEDRSMLASYGHFSFLHEGEEIIHQGQPQGSLYFVLSGLLHAKRSDSGREILVGEIHIGESFGEVNVFDPGEASATVVAALPSQLWSIEGADLQAFVSAYPEAGVHLVCGVASVLSKRLRRVSEQLVGKVEYESLISELKPG